MASPRISVVILSYNYADYLREAVRSAIAQRAGQYVLEEVVVVDDGSTDESLAVLAETDGVRVVRKEHEGFGPTITRGVREAHGDWVALLDADDYFELDKLSRLSPLLVLPDVMFVCHGKTLVGADGRRLESAPYADGSTSTLLIKKSAADSLLPVVNELFFHVLDDLGYGLRTKQTLVNYRVHSESMTDRRRPGAFQDYLATICTSLEERLRAMALSPPAWTSSTQLKEVADHYRERSKRHSRLALLERAKAKSATS